MSSASNIYGKRRSGHSHGDVFTAPEVVKFMLDLIGYTSGRDLSRVTILEPCCGDGAFLTEIISRIRESSYRFGFDFTEAVHNNVYACEIDKSRLESCIADLRCLPELANITFNNFMNEDFLLSEWPVSFDFIVGNPPYVRYENIPKDKRDVYKLRFRTFHYRPDLYVMFFEHSLSLLAPGGQHCFICANRWLRNEYGAKLRNLIATCFDLRYIVDIEQMDAFRESVLAYPAITVIANSHSSSRVRLTRIDSIETLSQPHEFQEAILLPDSEWDNLFTNTRDTSLRTIVQQGFRIGIGVATGADNVFIGKELHGLVEDELLIPVINARDMSGDLFSWGHKYLLNPYDHFGKPIDLDSYPLTRKYLEVNRPKLSERHIVKKGKCWYSLIDRIRPELLLQPKILIPDISCNKVIFVDTGEYYPTHNLYYITGRDIISLKLLAATLMSAFVRTQIEAVSTRMNGGLPRWQSQTLRKLKIPVIDDYTVQTRNELLNAYDNRDINSIDRIVHDAVSRSRVIHRSRTRQTDGQYLLDFT